MEVVQIPIQIFNRMCKALISVERTISEKEGEWVDKATALKLLGCSPATLFRLKGKEIIYKTTGKEHQYSKESIEKYNNKKSA